MAWNDWFKGNIEVEEKLNPAQPEIVDMQGGPEVYSTAPTITYTSYYETIEAVNRGINMIVDDVSEIPYKVGDKIEGLLPMTRGVHQKRVSRLLNFEPNPFQDISSFWRNCIIDLLLDGNIFIYFDGMYLYHMPASKMIVHASDTTYISHYEFNNSEPFYSPSQMVFIKENSFRSIYRGTSRLKPAQQSMGVIVDMKKFQQQFFRNGAVLGLVVTSPNTLSEKIKERMIQSWMTKYSPTAGGRRPLILDGGLDVKALNEIKFRDLDFQVGIEANEKIILKALGVPPILLDSGNNANLRPNHRLYYLETIVPIVRRITSAFEKFFGYEIVEDVTNIPALQPELKDQADYFGGLVNTGIITPNEAREKLGYESDSSTESDELRIPQNIAGSAANPTEGGKPPAGDANGD